MNLKELRTEIVKDNDDSLNNIEITAWINRALDDLSLVARYKKKTTITLVSGQTDYPLPSDFLKVVYVNSSGLLPQLPLNDFSRVGYKLIGNTISIQGAPRNGTLDMIYIANLPYLKGDTDIPTIPAPFHELLILFTIAKAKFVDELPEFKADAWNEYQMKKQEFIKHVNLLEGAPQKIRDVYGLNNGDI